MVPVRRWSGEHTKRPYRTGPESDALPTELLRRTEAINDAIIVSGRELKQTKFINAPFIKNYLVREFSFTVECWGLRSSLLGISSYCVGRIPPLPVNLLAEALGISNSVLAGGVWYNFWLEIKTDWNAHQQRCDWSSWNSFVFRKKILWQNADQYWKLAFIFWLNIMKIGENSN